MNIAYTRREYDCLLALRKRDLRRDQIKCLASVSDEDANIILSRLSELYYVKDNAAAWSGVLHLNDIGVTVAQAEFDRRFDMYLTRSASIAALVLSAVALIT